MCNKGKKKLFSFLHTHATLQTILLLHNVTIVLLSLHLVVIIKLNKAVLYRYFANDIIWEGYGIKILKMEVFGGNREREKKIERYKKDRKRKILSEKDVLRKRKKWEIEEEREN